MVSVRLASATTGAAGDTDGVCVALVKSVSGGGDE